MARAAFPEPEPAGTLARQQAIDFAVWEAERRRALAAQSIVAPRTPQAAAIIHGDTFRPPPRRDGRGGRPRRTNAAQGFDPVRAWATAIAPQITLTDYLDATSAAAEAVPDFPGDLDCFFERRFDGLRLADGAEIWSGLR